MESTDLHGKTALVTGAGQGIGRATALALARAGASLVLVGRGEPQLQIVAGEIESMGGRARAVPADVSRDGDVRALEEQAGPIDVLINNAGTIQPVAPVGAGDPAAWLRNIEINLYGTYLTCQYILPGMLDRGWGRIINVSSGAASGRTASWSAYSAAKAGVETLTKVIARENAGRGITANAVRPGIVDTSMQSEIRASDPSLFGTENLDRFRSYKERGMLRAPEDPAKLILWMLSPDAGDLNGEVLAIDDPDVAARIGLTPVSR